jgi:hypothetical protein
MDRVADHLLQYCSLARHIEVALPQDSGLSALKLSSDVQPVACRRDHIGQRNFAPLKINDLTSGVPMRATLKSVELTRLLWRERCACGCGRHADTVVGPRGWALQGTAG